LLTRPNHHEEGGKKDSDGGRDRPRQSRQFEPDEGRRDGNRARGNLTEGDRLGKFLKAQPVEAFHQFLVYEGNHGHPSAKGKSSDLQEEEG
jgi:hypothetical protein